MKDIADDEIRRAEEYRKSKHKRALKNRIKMGFFKLPKPGLFATVEEKPKTPKPKFLTKRLKAPERYEVLDELFDGVNLKQLEAKNDAVKAIQQKQRKDGEFAHADPISIIERNVPGAFHLDFKALAEQQHLCADLMGKEKVRIAEAKRMVKKKEKVPQPRGLFDYEVYDYADAEKRRNKQEEKIKRKLSQQQLVPVTNSNAIVSAANTKVDLKALMGGKKPTGKKNIFAQLAVKVNAEEAQAQ